MIVRTIPGQVLAWLLLLAALPLHAQTEMLVNRGFEGSYSGIAPGWTHNTWGTPAPAVSHTRETNNVRVGSACQKVVVSSLTSGGTILLQGFSFTPGHVYEAQLWARSPDNAQIQFLLRQPDKFYQPGANYQTSLGPNWQELVARGGFTEGNSAQFVIYFLNPGTVFLDGASLVDVTAEYLARPAAFDTPVPRSLFGIHINKLGQHNVWPALGQGVLRLWDTGTTWSSLEPTNDVWDFSRFDYYTNHAWKYAPNCTLIYTLGITPLWAAARTNETAYTGSTSEPTDLAYWRDYVRTVATRYRGRIKYYELWNECNYSGFYTGGVSNMVQLARIAWEELKSVDPEIKVFSPNVTDGGMGWLESFLVSGGAQYVDILSYHRYVGARPENEIGLIAGFQDMAARCAPGKIFWNTEGSAYTNANNSAPAVVARSYLVHWLSGVPNWSWYAWDIHFTNNGAILSQTILGSALADGGVAYREIATWLVGAQVKSKTILADGTWVVEIRRPAGDLARILWNPDQTVTCAIPSEWQVTQQRDLAGNAASLRGTSSLVLDSEPVLLEHVEGVPSGSTWKYLDTGVTPGADWTRLSFNDSSWPSGRARLGYGGDGEVTLVVSNRARIATYFRHSFVVSAPADYTALQMSLIRDDGAVVYLNGTEVWRSNLPTNGTILPGTYASVAVSGADESAWYTNSASPDLLVPGTNLIAVEVHQNGTNSSDLGFDFQLELQRSWPAIPPKVELISPAEGARLAAPATVVVGAQPIALDSAVTNVALFLGATPLAQWPAPPYSLTISNLPAGTHILTAIATDSEGRTASATRTIEVLPSVPATILPAGSNCKYFDAGLNLGAAWRSNGFDDSSWRSGPAQLGFGDQDEATLIASNGQWTTYFRREFYVPSTALVQDLTARLLRDDGAVVYLNGTEIWRDNMPSGTVVYSTPASSGLSGASETTWITRPLSPLCLVDGTNLLAVEIHQNTNNSSDLSFDFELTGMALIAAPSLKVMPQTGALQFSWPAGVTSFILDTATNCTPPVAWTRATNIVVFSNGLCSVRVPLPSQRQRFYRLGTP